MFRRPTPRELLLFVVLLCLLPAATAAAQTSAEPPAESQAIELRLAEPLQRDLHGGEVHTYSLTLVSGQFLHVAVEQQGIDLIVKLFAPDGQPLGHFDTPTGARGTERVLWIGGATGSHRLEVGSYDAKAAPGRYIIKVEELREATERDRSQLVAERASQEAAGLGRQGTAESTRKAIEKYEEALAHWRVMGDATREAETLMNLGGLRGRLSEYRKAVDHFAQALTIWQGTQDRRGQARALNGLGSSYYLSGENQKALQAHTEALALWRALEDRSGEARTLMSLGSLYDSWGDEHQALDYASQAAAIYRELGDRIAEARALAGVAYMHAGFGEWQKALDIYNQILPLQRSAGDRNGEAFTLHQIGRAYAQFGDQEKALEAYAQTLAIRRATGNRLMEAEILNYIGHTYRALGEYPKALEHYQQALALSRAIPNQRMEAYSLGYLGVLYYATGEAEKSRDHAAQAVALMRAVQDRAGEAQMLHVLGRSYAALGEQEKALDHFTQALDLMRTIGGRSDEAMMLYSLARLEADRGNLQPARAWIEAGLTIVESLRKQIASPELRASYFGRMRPYYELYINILMRLHRQEPGQGHAATGFHASERARARILLELLREARAEIRQGVDPALIERERTLQQRLNNLADRQMRLLHGPHTDEEATTLAGELSKLQDELGAVQSQVRASNPRYAALTQPQPLTLAEVQQQLLGPDILLLEYVLTEEKSYLWAVTQASSASYELPKREEIDRVARRVYELLTAPARGETSAEDYDKAARELSRLLLGPVESELKNSRRLIIVGEGVLQFLPFSALPAPVGSGDPLVVTHEIVTLPSASTLALLRQESSSRQPPARMLAILADPVFDSKDERVRRSTPTDDTTRQPDSASVATAPGEEDVVLRSAQESGLSRTESGLGLPRLLFTRREAEDILSLVARGEQYAALDFRASKPTATSPDLADYRLLHFATHGFLNSVHPELSGLVLSLVDPEGKPQDGFLRLHDVFNLNLRADVVVLSACQTGLGQQIHGEGLVGLTRGFMYAGAPRVLVSLWNVEDEATAALMVRFYRHLLGKKRLSPAAALRAAQLSMLKEKRWRSPFYWAAFVLQGEWR
ncbi:MAG: CHAT domain-containing protein [Acidobacteria bacterium]|nr:CHAT domain-containing protein [Acidobacteriota bacterium]